MGCLCVVFPGTLIEMTPLATYVIRQDDAHFRASVARIRAEQGSRQRTQFLSIGLTAVILVGLFVQAIVERNWSQLSIVLVPLALVAIVAFYLRKLPMDSFSKSPNYRLDISFDVTGTGIDTRGGPVSTRLEWTSFRKAVLGADDILLVMSDGSMLWLPNAQLVAGERAAVDTLIASRIPEVERRA